jgi:N-acetyl-anhydromuramyl-L-alanine amidase AmpD
MNVASKDLYTMRWALAVASPPRVDVALETLNRILGTPAPGETEEAVKEATDATRGRRLLRCPWAITRGLPEARTRGRYAAGGPKGAVVHFTAGSHKQKPEDAVDYQVRRGHCYFLIAPDGRVFQNFPLDRWGYHAGDSEKYPSKWPGLGFGVSDQLVGIEVMCPGKLDKDGSPWYSPTPFDPSLTRKVDGDDQREDGLYYRYTTEQEAALEKLIRWLENNDPDNFKFDFVLGHDEVSGPRGLGWRRKNDPGGSLSMSMDEFRAKLKGQPA